MYCLPKTLNKPPLYFIPVVYSKGKKQTSVT